MPLQNPASAITITTGSYTGDDSANKAIAHSLPGTPKLVVIVANLTDNNGECFVIMPTFTKVFCSKGGANSSKGVTAADSNNFYVGNPASYILSANTSGGAYRWVALH